MTTHHFTAGCPLGLDEIEVDIWFELSPYEPPQPNPDLPNPGPGCDASIEFVSAKAREWPIELPPFIKKRIDDWARDYCSSPAGRDAAFEALPEDDDGDDRRDRARDDAMMEGR